MVSSNKIRVGYPGRIFELPAPSSGMGFSNNTDVEVTELDSGGRFVYSKPTSYQSFNMSWRSTTPALQPLIDMYNKRYGRKPFYLQDLRGGEGNILPARWAYSWQLGAVFGAYGSPVVDNGGDNDLPSVTFNGNAFDNHNPSVTVMLIPGKDHYLAPFGEASTLSTGSRVQYTKFNKNTRVWEAGGTVAPIRNGSDAPTKVCTAAQTDTYDFIRISLKLTSSYMTLYHMDLSTTDYRSSENFLRPAVGLGGLEFTNELGGDLTMLRAQRIGLSVDITEVE